MLHQDQKLFALTLAQQDILFDQLKHLDSPMYNIGGYIQFQSLDLARLQKVHAHLVMLHDVYGLRITLTNDEVVQYISPSRSTSLEIIDFSRQGEPEADAWQKKLFETCFEIENKELFKAYLLVLSETNHRYIGIAHHLIMDGWGFANWAEQLLQLYAGQTALAQSLPWANIVENDALYLSKSQYQRDQEFWAEKLAALPAPFLPKLHQHEVDDTNATGGRVSLDIPQSLHVALQQTASSLGISETQIYLASVIAYFSLAYEQPNLCIGLPSHNRSGARQKQVVGVFTSVSLLSVSHPPDMSFSALCANLSQEQRQLYRHKRLPIGHMLRAGNTDASQRDRLYDVSFNYLVMDANLCIGDGRASLHYVPHNHEQIPIIVTLWEKEPTLPVSLLLDYNTIFFCPEQVASIGERLLFLLQQVVANPSMLLTDFDLIPESEKASIRQMSRGQVSVATGCNVLHQPFEHTSRQYPDNIALVFGGATLTYAELNRRANQFAHYLATQPYRSGNVGICLRRSGDVFITILGTLKAGRTFVPLDPQYPRKRLAHMAQDAELDLIFCHEGLAAPFDDAPIVYLDRQDTIAELSTYATKNPPIGKALHAEPAYIIYTSGSTGLPKGVVVAHEAIGKHLATASDVLAIAQCDKVLQLTSHSFDTFLEQSFATLGCGGQLVVSPQSLIDATHFFALLHQHDITLVDLAPAYLSQLLHIASAEDWAGTRLTRVVVGGESLAPQTILRWFDCPVAQQCQLINAYGPTECVVTTSYHRITRREDAWYNLIGSVAGSRQIRVLSSTLKPCPLGVPGQLFVAGECLASGYWNNPEATRAAFTDTSPASTLLYGTGDQVYQRHDGKLVYIGRKDDQIKVRGFRIELGEIESQLAQLSDVEASCVRLISRSAKKEALLVAYVVSSARESSTLENEILDKLSALLPKYMVPERIMCVSNFPLNANGKIDKEALPLPEKLMKKKAIRNPKTPIERGLIKACQRVLDIPAQDISLEDNFFQIGGHSLLAMKLVSLIRKQLDRDCPIKCVFEAATIGGLANEISALPSSYIPSLNLSEVTLASTSLLSFAQQRLWFIDQMQQGSPEYNMCGVYDVQGTFVPELAEHALMMLIKRHESLRTQYSEGAEYPVQKVLDTFNFYLERHDLSNLAPDIQEEQWQCILDNVATTPFDLQNDLLLTACYVHLSKAEQGHRGRLILSIHHIAADGWSVAILEREFAALYQALAAGEPIELDTPKLTYRQYAQAEQRQGDFQQQLAYWHGILADAPELHGLPLDFERQETETRRTASHVHDHVNADISEQLHALAQAHSLTLFMVIHGALSTVIARHANQHDVIIGTPVANRSQFELEDLVGLFVNSLVLRTEHSNSSYNAFWEHIKSVNLQAQQYADVPFDFLCGHLNINRTALYSPIFQIFLVLNERPVGSLSLGDCQLSPMQRETSLTKFDLELHVNKQVNGLAVEWVFDNSIFSSSHVAKINQHFMTVLRQFASSEGQSINEIQMLSADEQVELLRTLQPASLDYPKETLIHQLFEQHAKDIPANTAISCEDKTISYGELNQRANLLANHMIAKGYRDARVGVCMTRNINMVVALLATLKSGNAYVPMDPSYPEARLSHIAEDAAIRILICDEQTQHILVGQDIQALLIDTVGSIKTQPGAAASLCSEDSPLATYNPDLALSAESPAYVIYTSGSTGTPKGVVIRHRNTCAMLHWAKQTFTQRELRSVLASTSLNFDLSVFELFLPLSFGHQCVLVENALSLLAGDYDISMLNTVPSAAKALLEQDAIPKSIEVIDLAGEPLSASLLNQLLAQTQCQRVVNLYGPSEDTTYSTIASFTETISHVPQIGKVINNSVGLILSENLQLLPKGTTGELFLGGDGVALGYLNRPELTDAKFLSSPFGDGILYQTGDLVRYNKHDELEFLGRIDDQVKLNGFRIELGEVAHQLNQLLDIRESVVIVREDDQGIKQLIGYVVLLHGRQAAPTQQDIKQRLGTELPSYMVPSHVVMLDKLPLTQNGKINKKALPSPAIEASYNSQFADLTMNEKQVFQIIGDTLQLEPESLHPEKNFFDLGGHSLLAVKLSTAIQSALDTVISVKEIFECKSLLDIARKIESKPKRKIKPRIQAVDPKGRALFPLSLAQQRLWFLNNIEPDNRAQFNTVKAFRISGALNLNRTEQAIRFIIQRHQILRTIYFDTESGPVQQVQNAFEFELLQDDLSSYEPSKQQALLADKIRTQAAMPFDLGLDLMLRANYYHQSGILGAEEGVLLICLHHIAVDGWSVDVLVNELIHHSQRVDGQELSPLPELDIQYKDYAAWQQEFLNESWLTKKLDYWQALLTDAPLSHQLPLERPRREGKRQSGLYAMQIDGQTGQALIELSNQLQASLFMTLQTAFALHIGRLSNQTDIVLGGRTAGRQQAECKHLIGLFANTQVYRMVFDDNPNFVSLLKRTRKQHLAATQYNDVPFEAIVGRINPSRNDLASPIFQIMINLDNNTQSTFALDGVNFEALDTEELENAYDITLYIREDSDASEHRMTFEWAYETRLFEADTIELYALEFGHLLTKLVLNPSLPVLNHSWQCSANIPNSGRVASLRESFAQMFEKQATLAPDAVALSYLQESLTYSALNARVNQLANFLLQQYQVQGNQRIAVAMRRSHDQVVVIMAILKLGACYVPLSEEFPGERLDYIVSVSQICLIISDAGYMANNVWLSPYVERDAVRAIPFMDISGDEVEQQLIAQSTDNPEAIVIKPEDTAYLIFTSGSTGNPKGVAGTYQAILNRIQWMLQEMPFANSEVMAHLTSMAFIRSIWELLVALCGGAELNLVPRQIVKDVSQLWLHINRQGITWLVTAPSILKALIRMPTPDKALPVTHWFVSGEPITMSVARELFHQYPRVSLYNLYGSTEVMSDVSFYKIDPNWHGMFSPIGSPIDNTTLQIVGPDHQPVPPGVIGQILVQGIAVANGYINAPEKHASQFLNLDEQRTFCSGDIGYINRQGLLECLGRIDDQIKIYGYRVEPSEVTSCLESCGAVKSAVVTLTDNQDPKLVAYYVANDDEADKGELTPSEAISRLETLLCRALKSRLPDYMIPTYFIQVEQIPLRPNGKVNQQALPEPNALRGKVRQAPQTPLETQLCQLWAELLKVDEQKISTTCSFFDLGGHSLIVAQLLQRIEAQFQLRMSYGQLFNKNQIVHIAKLIEENQLRNRVIKSSRQNKKQLVL